MKTDFDVIIVGGGASGLMAAAASTLRMRNTAIFDMGRTPARKVMASGGGRCNFTNTDANVSRYFGTNPDFVRGALARVTPNDILAWAKQHNIDGIEKSYGQYFSSTGALSVVNALITDVHNAKIFTNTPITDIEFLNNRFIVHSDKQKFTSESVIIATGGTSFGALGVSDFGMRIAKKFGHKIIPPRPALCAIATNTFSSELSGISVMVEIKIGKHIINDSLLFTHFGIGGPATYRATVRDISDDIHINLLPSVNAYDWIRETKQTNGRKKLSVLLSEKMPTRLAKFITTNIDKNIADLRDYDIKQISQNINDIVIPHHDIKLHNLSSAEIIRGGIDTHDISSKTMESKLQPGLFFAGEVLDIAGDLGGFNLHWAWASGRTAGQNA